MGTIPNLQAEQGEVIFEEAIWISVMQIPLYNSVIIKIINYFKL